MPYLLSLNILGKRYLCSCSILLILQYLSLFFRGQNNNNSLGVLENFNTKTYRNVAVTTVCVS
jgi:hypothetical protein